MMNAKFKKMEEEGTAFTLYDGYKYIAMGLIVGLGAWTSAISVTETIDEFIKFYKTYSTQMNSEASDNGTVDSDGTSLTFDLSYPTSAMLFSFATSAAMAAATYIFGYLWLGNEL